MGATLAWTLCGTGALLFLVGLWGLSVRTRSRSSRPSESREYNPYDPYDRYNPHGLAQRDRDEFLGELDADLDDLLKLDD